MRLPQRNYKPVRNPGYTLIEMLIVLSVSAIIVSGVLRLGKFFLKTNNVIADKLASTHEENLWSLILKDRAVREVKMISPEQVIIIYNLLETDTLTIVPENNTLIKNGKRYHFAKTKPLNFFLKRQKNILLKVNCGNDKSFIYFLERFP